LNLEIKKIRLKELNDFVKSKRFNQFEILPISLERAKSYINNPNTKPENFVLYLGFINNSLVAFRSLFAGELISDDLKIRFAWCSGNWVAKDFRRKGFSEQLLKEAYSDWSGKLMFTNYAPNSEKLYLKTGWFHSIHKFNGVRAYLFPKTGKLVSRANSNTILKIIFSIIDLFIQLAASLRIFFYHIKTSDNIRFETISQMDEQCFKFKNTDHSKFLFNRDQDELQWIFNFSWISKNKNSIAEKYPFSSFVDSFSYQTVKIFVENKFAGFFLFSIREGHLKTLYFNVEDGIEKEIAQYLKQYCCNYKIEIITVYNSKIAREFFIKKFPFLHLKKYGQNIYSSFEINNNKKFRFQDGDGDVIFT
jgi:hypothetical protein